VLNPLTKRQFDVYTFIVKYQRKQGIMPTLREIAEASGHKSQAAIHKHIGELVSRGYLRRHANLSRALEITEEAQALAAAKR
jgi:repressor LexA